VRITVASLVPTAWPISRADMAPARGPVAKRNSATVRSTGLLRSPDLAAKVPDVVFSSDFGVICSKCYTLRRGWNVKNEGLLLLAIILATAVEMVEALTIALAVGVTRGWRATLAGVGAAFVVLGLVVATVGPAISHLSFTPLRLVVGGLVLLFGIQWTRKAILRTSGYTARHDEDAIYDSTRVSATEAPSAEGAGIAWPGGESAIPVLIALLAGTSALFARALRRQHGRTLAPQVSS
jgi:hypothetical protein